MKRVDLPRLTLSLEFDDPFDAALLVHGIEEHAQALRAAAGERELHEYARVGMADTVRVLDGVAAQLSAQILTSPIMAARMRVT